MTRSELIAKLTTHYPGLVAKDVAVSIAVILTAIANRLAEGGRAEIRDFGTFSPNLRPARMGHNPATGAPVSVRAKYVPHFKPGRELRDRVATSANSEERSTPAHASELEHEPG